MIRAVLFDAAGTLIHLRHSVGEGYARVARRHGFDLDPSSTDRAFRNAWRSMPPPGSAPATGTGGERAEKAWWRQLVDQVLTAVAPSACNDPDAYFEDLFAEYAKPELWSPYPETHEVLVALRRRSLRLCALSNFDARLLPILDGHGLRDHFEQVFYSGKTGHAKPSRASFIHATSSLGLAAEECLHVGDDPVADWQGARAAGLATFELDRSKHDLRALLAG